MFSIYDLSVWLAYEWSWAEEKLLLGGWGDCSKSVLAETPLYGGGLTKLPEMSYIVHKQNRKFKLVKKSSFCIINRKI